MDIVRVPQGGHGAINFETGVGPIIGIIGAALSLLVSLGGLVVSAIGAVQFIVTTTQQSSAKLGAMNVEILDWDVPRRSSERPSSTRRGAVASALAAAVALVLSACGPADDGRPEPNALVEQYLTAIAEGDAAAASELDAAAIEEAHGGDESIDVQSLRVDEVLEFAENRIDDIAVNERSHPGDHGPDTRRVSFAFTIADDEYDSSLEVRWEEDSAEWRLTESLTVNFSTEAVRNQASYESAPFQIAGISRTLSEDPGTAPLRYLVYPGVYRVTSAIPAELLTRDAEPVQDVVATATADTGAQFDVVRLPSDAE